MSRIPEPEKTCPLCQIPMTKWKAEFVRFAGWQGWVWVCKACEVVLYPAWQELHPTEVPNAHRP